MDKERARFLAEDYLQGFPAHCGFKVDRIDDGVFETSLAVEPRHRQQDDLVHAGVMATMADHTAGYACYTLTPPGGRVLTIEFKINFLRPAGGAKLICRSTVIRPGRKVMVAESEIFTVDGDAERLAAKATVTIMVVPAEELER